MAHYFGLIDSTVSWRVPACACANDCSMARAASLSLYRCQTRCNYDKHDACWRPIHSRCPTKPDTTRELGTRCPRTETRLSVRAFRSRLQHSAGSFPNDANRPNQVASFRGCGSLGAVAQTHTHRQTLAINFDGPLSNLSLGRVCGWEIFRRWSVRFRMAVSWMVRFGECVHIIITESQSSCRQRQRQR